MGLNSCGNILNGSEHGLHTRRATYGNVVLFSQKLHHHVHVTGASKASITHAQSSRSKAVPRHPCEGTSVSYAWSSRSKAVPRRPCERASEASNATLYIIIKTTAACEQKEESNSSSESNYAKTPVCACCTCVALGMYICRHNWCNHFKLVRPML